MYQTLQGQGLSYFKEPTLQQDATKQSSLLLQYHPAATQASLPVSNSHLNQQYQTISHQAPQPAPVSEHAAIANNGQAHYLVSAHQLGFHQMPVFNQHQVYFGHQPQNQYTVKHASVQQQAGQTGLPSSAYNKEHSTAQFPNGEVGRFFHQNTKPVVSQTINPVPQISAKQVTAQPLIHSQVYHPLHTSVNAQQQTQQTHAETPRMSPPTPPRIYKNFHPMIPKPVPSHSTIAPIKQEVQEQNENSSIKQEEESEEEENQQKQVEEDDDHDNYKQENDDHDTYKQEDDSDDEKYSRPANYNFANKFKHEYDDHDYYRHYQNDDEEDDGYKGYSHKYSENKPEYSKLSSKHNYPNNQEGFRQYTTKEHAKPVNEYKSYKTGSDFKKPNMQYKMYQYTKSSKKPHSKDNFEGKESEIIPKVHATKNLYEEKWMITKTSSSMK